jgi:hypothetical protein
MSTSAFEAHLGSAPEIQKHFDDTSIADETSYIGKEHFWQLLIDEGVTQNQASRLYEAIAFPWLRVTRPAHAIGSCPVDPAELGIEVGNRRDVGVPYPPFLLTALLRNTGSTRVVGRHQKELGHSDDEISRVIRVGSLVVFANKLSGAGLIEGMPKSVKLSGIGPGGVPAAQMMAHNLRQFSTKIE